MKHMVRRSVVLLGVMATFVGFSPIEPLRAETLVGSLVDNRTTVAFRSNQTAVQSWLPDPWQVNPIATGPFKDANLLVLFIDRLLYVDPEGKPAAGGTFRIVALVTPARHSGSGESALFVIRVYQPQDTKGPYKNSVRATLLREASMNGANVEPGAGSEHWKVRVATGGELEFKMKYQRSTPKWSKKEIKPHSAADPGLFYIYRYEQLTDVVKSVAKNTDRVQGLVFRAAIPELDGLFDGAEEIVGIAFAPWYKRQTFRP